MSFVVGSLAIAACAGEVDDDAAAGENLVEDGSGDEETGDPNLRARVCANGATTKGIDISKWQGTIDWAKVKTAGIEFAFVRVSDGANTKDLKFASNWSGAKAAGIIRGAYQFFRPSQSVTTQADLMIDALGGTYTPGDLPPVIDVEDDGGLSPATVAARTRQWVDRVSTRLGVKPIVYTGKFFWRDEVGSPASFAPNPLWIAQYTSLCPDLPAPWARWTFWQYTDAGSVNGIAGGVDMNRFNGTVAQLRAFAMGTAPTTTPPITFSWTRGAAGAYRFDLVAPPGTAKVELRVENYLIGAATLDTTGHGSLTYTFNVATPNRAIEARGLSASGAAVSLGNGIIDSQAGAAIAIRQTGEHEYEIGYERAATTWNTMDITVEGVALTDLDTSTTRSTRGAIRYKFNGLGERPLTIVARDAAGSVVNTQTRTLLVR